MTQKREKIFFILVSYLLSNTNLGAKVVIFFDIRKRVRFFCNELIKNDGG